MLKCFDFECSECGIFEHFFDTSESDGKTANCPECSKESERVHVVAPNVDRFAFSIWNNHHDSQTGTFTDKKAYYRAIESQGRLISEPGMDKDALSNHKAHVAKMEKALDDKMDNYIKDYTLDELRGKIAVDRKIHDATMRGDGNAIKAMGGLTSLDEAYERVNK